MKIDEANFVQGRLVSSTVFPFKFLRLACYMLAVCCFGQSVIAQEPAKSPTPVPNRPQAVLALLNDARIAAPEIGVDIFIKVAQSKKVTEPLWRREILEEAYRMAGDVKNPVRRKAVPFKGVPVDTHAAYLSYAYDLKLDGLSLKSRVIRQLVSGDKQRARQIVFEIGGRLGLRPLKCEDALVYEVSEIYGAAGAVAQAVFSQKEINEGLRALYIAPWFENLESPAQIGPALDLLAGMRGSPMEKQFLFNALSTAINHNFNDDRSFTYAVERDRLATKVGQMVSGTADLHLKADLLSAFRGFLVKNLRSTRCKDNEISGKEKIPNYIGNANYLFPEKPLTFEDIEYSDLKGSPEIVHHWKSTAAIRLQREFRELRGAQKKDEKTTGEMPADDWGIKVSAFVENLEAWKASDNETESEVFNQKCVLFRTLVGIIPDGTLKKSVFRSFMRFLGNSSLQKESFIEWLNHVRWLSSANAVLFNELASESPNQHFRLIVDTKRLGL